MVAIRSLATKTPTIEYEIDPSALRFPGIAVGVPEHRREAKAKLDTGYAPPAEKGADQAISWMRGWVIDKQSFGCSG